MESWQGPGFVIAIIAIVMLGKIINNYIRVRHGYSPEELNRRGFRGRSDSNLDAERRVTLLTNENERLNGQVSRLEERITVLERIATDPAERTAREIDALRDR